MNVPLWVWPVTIVGLLALLAIDLVLVERRPHRVQIGETAKWVAFYLGCAVLFGIGLWITAGGRYAGEFFAGYITEYSLSVDNLFVFLVIMRSFAVPAIRQHKVLLFGIVAALFLRGAFILVGAGLIDMFSWTFYLFGAFLIVTACRVFATRHEESPQIKENGVLRWLRKVIPVTKGYEGTRMFVWTKGRIVATPMLVVMVAIGTADVLFAVDSIPAIFGLTKEPFLVFSANAFALMGLRQLYFLLGGMLERLTHLSKGLGVILAFIGLKLTLEALAGNELPFINDGQPVPVPEIGTGPTLLFVVGVLAITTVASLITARRQRTAF